LAAISRLTVEGARPSAPAIERALSEQVGGVDVRFATRDDLIAMKERASSDPARRPSKATQDRADIQMLRGDVAEPDEGW